MGYFYYRLDFFNSNSWVVIGVFLCVMAGSRYFVLSLPKMVQILALSKKEEGCLVVC